MAAFLVFKKERLERMKHVIYGPPGTGKSTEIIRRVNTYIEKGVPTNRIGLSSYTKVASEELGKKATFKSRYIGTLHSLAFKMAGCIYAQTVNYLKLKDFEKMVGIEFTGGNPDDAETELSDGDYYLSIYSLCQAKMTTDYRSVYTASGSPGSWDAFNFFVEAYNAWKNSQGYVDFNDMLKMALTAPPVPVDVLFIDEAQDLSRLQWSLINYWCESVKDVHIAGDDDQAIYGWAGAVPTGMFDFEKKHDAERLILDQSYRIPKAVHIKANEIIENVSSRVDKPYKPRDFQGGVYRYSEIDHIDDIDDFDAAYCETFYEDTLILYRNHSMRRSAEEFLQKKGIPYITDNGKPGLCQGWYWKLVTLFIKIQNSDLDTCTLKPAQESLLKQGLHAAFKQELERGNAKNVFNRHWSEALHIKYDVESYFKRLEMEMELGCANLTEIKPRIHLSSIHGAKGREADRVILFNGMGQKSAERFYGGDTDSEARVFYVGVTRAKKRLDIVMAENSLSWL